GKTKDNADNGGREKGDKLENFNAIVLLLGM
ncbi:MAG: hypothetical protein ACJASI_001601, partial [Glaciecola sp.]